MTKLDEENNSNNKKSDVINSEDRRNRINAEWKLFFLLFIFLLMLSVYMFKVVNYKVVHGEEYEMMAKNQQINRYDAVITPNRGSILDRNEQVLAISTAIYNVVLEPLVLSAHTESNQNLTITTLCQYFPELSEAELRRYITENPETGQINLPNNWKYLIKGISRELKEELESFNLKGVYFEQVAKRSYPLNSTACHLIGFIRGDSSWGIEKNYNDYMKGVSGRSFIMYESNRDISYQEYDAQDGNTIITTIDYNIQQFAEEIVKDTYDKWPAQSIMAIVMNPNTGEIIAMADEQQFDLNNPSVYPRTLEDEVFAEMWGEMDSSIQFDYLNRMWGNFAISSTFEPGSTFKPAVVAAALEEGIIKPDDTFYCEGGVTIYDTFIACHVSSGHGVLNIEQILAQSCNPGMVQISERLGAEKMYEYQKTFSFGELTGIDLPAEVSASNLIHSVSSLLPVELATTSIGQTFNATAIQNMVAFASLINGGNILEPYVVSKIVDQRGNMIYEKRTDPIRRSVSTAVSDYIREALKATVEVGTGRTIAIPGYSIGSKTGTAEQGDRARNDLWTFSHMTYFPVENPQYLIFTVIHLPDNYSQGTQSTAPMTKALLEKIIDYKNIQPSVETATAFTLNVRDTVKVGNYIGGQTQMVVSDLVSKDLVYQVVGTGNNIVNQVPKSGTDVQRGSEIILYVERSEADAGKNVVPNLVGMSYEMAVEELDKFNFDIIITGNIQNSVVASQSPAYGISIDPGSEVTIKLEPAPVVEVEVINENYEVNPTVTNNGNGSSSTGNSTGNSTNNGSSGSGSNSGSNSVTTTNNGVITTVVDNPDGSKTTTVTDTDGNTTTTTTMTTTTNSN